VLVVPSIWLENAPLTILEAFLAGVPVVCSDLGGMAEMVEDGVSGLRFRPGDAEDLREKLLRLVREPGLLERLRRGIPAVRRIEDDVRELRAHFGRLAQRARLPRIAAVIVNRETAELTLRSAHSILGVAPPVDQLFVVDNGSRDGSAEDDRTGAPEARLVKSERNLGFAAGANLGLRSALDAEAELVLLVNSDARIDPDCLGQLERALETDAAVAIAGPAIVAAEDPERIESLGLAFSAASGRFRELGRVADARERGAQRSVDALVGVHDADPALCAREDRPLRRGLLLRLRGRRPLPARPARGLSAASSCLRPRVWHEGHATIGRRSPERPLLRRAQPSAPGARRTCARRCAAERRARAARRRGRAARGACAR
jgi:hypothetical protein